MIKNRFRNEAGQAMVEFVLIAPIFFFILFGIMEVGWTAYQRILFYQGCGRATYEITGRKLLDRASIEESEMEDQMDPNHENQTRPTVYTGKKINATIKESIDESAFWGFKKANLDVLNGKAELWNVRTETTSCGKDNEEVKSYKISRLMNLTGTIQYTVYPITGLGKWYFGDSVVFTKDLDCERILAEQQRTE